MMDDKTIKSAFPIMLKYYMELRVKTRNDIVRDLKFKYTTVRDWEIGMSLPRMDKAEKLANYLGCTTTDLLEIKKQPVESELSFVKREFMKKVEKMSDAQIERLEQILALVENTDT